MRKGKNSTAERVDLGRHIRSEEHTSELQSHSDLPSFPTRRSSDLPNSPAELRVVNGAIGKILQTSRGSKRRNRQRRLARPRCALSTARRKHRLPSCARAKTALLSGLTSAGTSDRKSTRLNSSHTVIYPLSLHDALPIYPTVRQSCAS